MLPLQTVWAIFDDQGVSCKQLQVWVYYLLHRGLSKSSTFCDKERALFSADLCFLLLKERGKVAVFTRFMNLTAWRTIYSPRYII